MKCLTFIAIAFFLISADVYSQIVIDPLPIHKRTSDLFKYDAAVYPFGVSKFLQNLNVNGYDEWTSVSSVISINGIPYNTLPFNYTSPDFVPIELIQIGEAVIEHKSNIKNGIALPSGGLNIVTRPISDSLRFSLRAFTGSETGDPLIYRFTREQVPIVNKNKIVPSFVLSAEGGSKFKYRLTGAYFGYFAFNSSENSLVLSALGNSLTKRQNRQMLGSAEVEYAFNKERKISLFSSFINFYGWEVPPFITSFIHLRTFNYANRLTFYNLLDKLDAGIKADGNVSRIWELDLIFPALIQMKDVSFFARWTNRISSKAEISLHSEAGNYDIYDVSEGNRRNQLMISRGIAENYFYYYVSPQLHLLLSERLQITLSNRFEKNINPNHSYSGALNFSYSNKDGHNINLLFSTIASNPGVFEKYGAYETSREINSSGSLRHFIITGNQTIRTERVNSISASLNFKISAITLNVNPFIRNVLNPIVLKNRDIFATSNPGDIIRNAYYKNGDELNFWGFNSKFTSAIGFLNLSLSHSGMYYNKIKPSNRFLALTEINTSSSGDFILEYIYSSSKTYKEFEVNKTSLFSSTIPQISLFSISYTHRLEEFYFLKNINASIRIDNIFNKQIKFHPFGNNMDRTIEFYLAFKI